ncbi:RelA/SpoT family protein [Bacteroidales bacterium OttesenSCG-928-C19]|nr:RelA/SpoT family protein [Bacteroidales bacterium OttesenSCG-928-C19]
MYVVDEKAERTEILRRYKHLISIHPDFTQEEKRNIRKAFTISMRAHSGMRRKSGEPYIIHPLEVARIASEEIGLGSVAIVCALLHDVVEDTNMTLDDIQTIFGETVAKIIDGLTKIEDIFDYQNNSIQAENFKKLLLTMVDDVRVILIKLCDRLHNMRTLDSMPNNKQLAISSETSFIYVPLAHRLGLYTIKSEMEELVMKYTNPGEYTRIKKLVEETQPDRDAFISDFIHPIDEKMEAFEYPYSISNRVKSIYSIWNKMQKKAVDFEEIYDLFAIRIVVDVPIEIEKQECFKIYAMIVSLYKPSPTRFRDWVSNPKANGYEAIHTTVMSHSGRWVEVQIRSKRMDEIAEKGMAAHFKYKENHPEDTTETAFDIWLQQIRATLENASKNALDFLDDFKMNLYDDEIFAFTPKGKMISLPKGATVLDFAFAVHSNLGASSMGAKVNYKVVANNHVLKSGDQVQILISKKVEPEEEWLAFVKTVSAKQKIKQAIRERKKVFRPQGERLLRKLFKDANVRFTTENIANFKNHLQFKSNTDYFYDIATGKITINDVRNFFKKKEKNSPWLILASPFNALFHGTTKKTQEEIGEKIKENIQNILIEEGKENLPSRTAPCCNPIPGDDVIGFVEENEIVLHRTNCPVAIEEMSKHKNRMIKAKWRENESVTFLAGIRISTIDRKGLLQDVVNLISTEKDLNIRGLTIESSQGVGVGVIMLYISNVESLNNLIRDLKKLDGIESVVRM